MEVRDLKQLTWEQSLIAQVFDVSNKVVKDMNIDSNIIMYALDRCTRKKSRDIIFMRHKECKTFREISESLNANFKLVTAHYNNAINKMRYLSETDSYFSFENLFGCPRQELESESRKNNYDRGVKVSNRFIHVRIAKHIFDKLNFYQRLIYLLFAEEDIERLLERQVNKSLIVKSLNKCLTDVECYVVMEKLYYGKTYKDIAYELNRTNTTIAYTFYRAVGELTNLENKYNLTEENVFE